MIKQDVKQQNEICWTVSRDISKTICNIDKLVLLFMMGISKANTKVFMSFLIHVRKTKVHRLLISLGLDIVCSISMCSITIHSDSIPRGGCGLISSQSMKDGFTFSFGSYI